MFNRSEIFRSAWAAYRRARPAFCAAGDTADHRAFVPSLFGRLLRQSWADARKASVAAAAKRAADAEQALARSIVTRLQQDRIAVLAALSAADRSARLSGVADELRMLDYAPWSVNAAQRRAQLNAEVELLEAADARAAELNAIAA